MKARRLLFLGFFSVCCAAVLILQSNVALGENTIKIGVVVPLSGAYSVIGDRTVKGLEFGVDEINAKGGLLGGKKLELVKKDSETNPEICVRVVKRLILQDKVLAIYGPLHCGAAIGTSNVVKGKAILFPMAAVEDLITRYHSRYTWRVGNCCGQKSRAGALVASKNPELKRWAFISPDFTYGYSVVNNFYDYLQELVPGIKAVCLAWPKLGNQDYSPYINKIIESKPDALHVGIFGADCVRFIKQANMFGLFDKMKVYFDDNAHQSVLESMGDEIPFGSWTGIRYYWRAPKTKANDDFVKAFKRKFDMLPDTFSGESYAAVLVLAAAIERANSTNLETLIEKGLSGLRIDTPSEGSIYMRPEDGQGVQSVHWGQYVKSPEYPFPIVDNIIEISGEACTPDPCAGKARKLTVPKETP